MKAVIHTLLIICLFSLAHCSGNECSATNDFTNDRDSDCSTDSSDNCPDVYNPDQFDGDNDNVGEACDADDTSSSVASISEEPPESVKNPIFLDEDGNLNESYDTYFDE